ncbi:MAG TPA: hypothetical protein ENH49_06970 [Candidatus Marinimicrobia bacterium]|nr:hypothetical protein [Candidatus Neomarinimicrobiota bacterium]
MAVLGCLDRRNNRTVNTYNNNCPITGGVLESQEQEEVKKMTIEHTELPNAGLASLFPYKNNQIIIAPETKKVYTVKKDNSSFGPDFRLFTFRGISPGAVHYYGCITLTLFLLKTDDGLISCGYSGGIQFDGYLKIEIVRILSKEEVYSNADRWGHHSDDTTECFDSVDEIIDILCSIYDKWFENGPFQVCGGIPENKDLSLRECLVIEKDYL